MHELNDGHSYCRARLNKGIPMTVQAIHAVSPAVGRIHLNQFLMALGRAGGQDSVKAIMDIHHDPKFKTKNTDILHALVLTRCEAAIDAIMEVYNKSDDLSVGFLLSTLGATRQPAAVAVINRLWRERTSEKPISTSRVIFALSDAGGPEATKSLLELWSKHQESPTDSEW